MAYDRFSDRRDCAMSGGVQRAAHGVVWSLVLQWSRFGINTVVFLILARWLPLAEIGVFSVAYAPARLLQAVQRAGFSEAVVQERDHQAEFVATVHWMSVAFGASAALCLAALAYPMASLVSSDDVAPMALALAALPFLTGVSAAPEGVLRRRLEIRSLAIRTVTSLTIAAVVALAMAIYGYGAWALVGFAVFNTLVAMLLVVAQTRLWFPRGAQMAMARIALRPIAAISARNLVSNATMPVLQLIVGAQLGLAAAGAFQIAQRFLTLVETIALSPARFVALPIMVRVGDDPERLRRSVVDITGLINIVCAPLYFGLAVVSPLALPLIVGEQNASLTIPTLQILLMIGAAVSVIAVFNQVMTVIGKPELALQRSIWALSLTLTLGYGASFIDLTWLAAAYAAVSYVLLPSMLLTMRKQLGVSLRDIAVRCAPPLGAAGLMVMAVLAAVPAVTEIGAPDWAVLAAAVVLGGCIYMGTITLADFHQVTGLTKLMKVAIRSRGAKK